MCWVLLTPSSLLSDKALADIFKTLQVLYYTIGYPRLRRSLRYAVVVLMWLFVFIGRM